MLIDIAVAGMITVLASTYSYQVGKHGTKYVWRAMFKDDAPKLPAKHEPKHALKVYDWEHDAEFKKSLERKNA